jgi:hypothetical protein
MSDECKRSRTDRPSEGRYANYFEVGYNAFEFLLDCGQRYSDSEGEHVHTRIVTPAVYMKLLLETLQESVAQYERQWTVHIEEHGPVVTQEDG